MEFNEDTFSEETISQIIHGYLAEGKSYRTLAHEHGISRTTIMNILKSLNINRNALSEDAQKHILLKRRVNRITNE